MSLTFQHLTVKHDPPKRKHHIQTFCNGQNNHIYSRIHELKTSQQKQEENKPREKAPIDDYINEQEERPKYNMIDDTNDILKIDDTNDILNMIHIQMTFWAARGNGRTIF